MLILKKQHELSRFLAESRSKGSKIGFVPTMGALHKGHMALVQQSMQENDLTVCSIFVNPTQFNDKNDLSKYPRPFEQDKAMLENIGCDVCFYPSEEEMYPGHTTEAYDFGRIAELLEGKHRPGHFNGVGQIVTKLFRAVGECRAYFGLKDYQQVLIVKKLVEIEKLNVQIIPCEIVREVDGLAMSSRNMLLTVEERNLAANIPTWMNYLKEHQEKGIVVLKEYLNTEIAKHSLLRLEYIAFCDKNNLEEVEKIEKGKTIVLIALFCGKIRLIDNLIL